MAFANSAPTQLAKIHEKSHDTVNTKLDLFYVPPTETTETGSQYVSFQPMTAGPSSQIQVTCPASSEHFTDLENSYFLVNIAWTKKDGEPLAKEAKIFPVSNQPHVVWDRMTLRMNSSDVDYNASYGTTSAVLTHVDETKDSKQGRLTGEGWIEDSCSGVDWAQLKQDGAVYKERVKLCAEGRTGSYFMRPFLSLMRQRRVIPPGVSLQVTLTRSDIKMCMMASEEDPDVKLEVTHFEWVLHRMNVNHSVVRAMNHAVIDGSTFKLPIKKHRTRVHTLPANIQYHRVVVDENDNVSNRLIVTMLDHRAYVGDFKRSPYKYWHYDLESIELTIDGCTVGKRLDMDFAAGRYANAYVHTIANLGQLNSDVSNGITFKEFGQNKCIFVWNLATSLPSREKELYFHLRRKANVALKLTFKTPITDPITVQITDEREDLLELDLENRVRSVTGVV